MVPCIVAEDDEGGSGLQVSNSAAASFGVRRCIIVSDVVTQNKNMANGDSMHPLKVIATD